MKSFFRSAEATAESQSEHQARVDKMVAMARAEQADAQLRPERTAFTPPPPPVVSHDPLDHRIREEIDYARRYLDTIGDILGNNAYLLHKHARELQSLDLVNQMLGHLGRVIVAQDRAAAVATITLEDLRARLQRESLAEARAKLA